MTVISTLSAAAAALTRALPHTGSNTYFVQYIDIWAMHHSRSMGEGLRTPSNGLGSKVPLQDCTDVVVASSANGWRLQLETEDNQHGNLRPRTVSKADILLTVCVAGAGPAQAPQGDRPQPAAPLPWLPAPPRAAAQPLRAGERLRSIRWSDGALYQACSLPLLQPGSGSHLPTACHRRAAR